MRRAKLSKVVILHSGQLFLNSSDSKEAPVDLATEVLGKDNSETLAREFEILIEGMPSIYLEKLPETRWGSPFVVTVTEAGIAYLDKER